MNWNFPELTEIEADEVPVKAKKAPPFPVNAAFPYKTVLPPLLEIVFFATTAILKISEPIVISAPCANQKDVKEIAIIIKSHLSFKPFIFHGNFKSYYLVS